VSKAKVTVRRPPGDLLGARYLITLTLDERKIARLRPGESVSREVDPGHHSLRAYNTLVWKTVEFDLDAGGSVEFAAANRTSLWSEMAAFIGFGLFGITLERQTSS
jgi:hypothetical protein